MIEETIKTLSDYQIQALRKGISCDINIEFNNQKVPTAEIRMRYSVTGGISRGHTFVTTFSDNLGKSKTEERLNSVEHFISTVTE